MTCQAALPRVLDIRTFVNARGPEVAALFHSLEETKGTDGFGAPALPRHLRRRATGHNRRVCRKRPNLKFTSTPSLKKTGKKPQLHLTPVNPDSVLPDAGPQPATSCHEPLIPASKHTPMHIGGSSLNQPLSSQQAHVQAASMAETLAGAALGVGRGGLGIPVACSIERPTNRAMRRRPARQLAAAVHSMPACLQLPASSTAGRGAIAVPQLGARSCSSQKQQQNMHEPQHQHGSMDMGIKPPLMCMGMRSPALNQQEHHCYQQQQEALSCIQQHQHTQQQHQRLQLAPPRRLETHAWHTRRMRMTGCEAGEVEEGGGGGAGLWGHSLALHAGGKGKGSRSFLHQLRSQCVMHDASYWGCLQLSGQQKDIVSVLELVSEQQCLAEQLARAEVICGAVEWPLVVYQAERPTDQGSLHKDSKRQQQQEQSWQHSSEQQQQQHTRRALGPTRALWLVSHQHNGGHSLGGTQPTQKQQGDKAAHHSSKQRGAADGWYGPCGLWLWVHATAFQDVCHSVMEAASRVEGSVSIQSKSHELRRLEVVGGASDDAIHKVVHALASPSPAKPQSPDTRASAPGNTSLPLRHPATHASTPSNQCGAWMCGNSLWQAVAADAKQGHQADCGSGSTAGLPQRGQRSRRRRGGSHEPGSFIATGKAGPQGVAKSVGIGSASRGGVQGGAGSAGMGDRGAAHSSAGGLFDRLASQAGRQQQGALVAALAAPGTSSAASMELGACGIKSETTAPGSADLEGRQGPSQKQHQPAKPWVWPAECVVGVTACDPRLLNMGSQPSRAACELEQKVKALADGDPNIDQVSHKELHAALRHWPDSGDWTDGAHSLLYNSLDLTTPVNTSTSTGNKAKQTRTGSCVVNSSSSGLAPPFSDQSISLIRHAACQETFLLLPPGSSRALQQQEQQQQAQQAAKHSLAKPAEPQLSCPVLLVRRQYGASLAGWSLVLPAGWAAPFWNVLSFTGARPAGQTEWRWVASECGCTCFPWDWPHTPAGARLTQHLAHMHAHAVSLRPLGREPKPPGMAYCPWGRLGSMTIASASLPSTPAVGSNTTSPHRNGIGLLSASSTLSQKGAVQLLKGSTKQHRGAKNEQQSSEGSSDDSEGKMSECSRGRDRLDGGALSLPRPSGKAKQEGQSRRATQSKQQSESAASQGELVPKHAGQWEQERNLAATPPCGWRVAHSLQQLRESLVLHQDSILMHSDQPRSSIPGLGMLPAPGSHTLSRWAVPASSSSDDKYQGDKGRLCTGPRALSKALATGSLVWVPQQPQQQKQQHLLHAMDSQLALGPASPLSGSLSEFRRLGGQVWAWVRVVGRGRCEEGAQLSVPSAAAFTSPSPAAFGAARSQQFQELVIIGYIVSASPRGLSPPSLVLGADGTRLHAGYPGGLALCDLTTFWDMRAATYNHCNRSSFIAQRTRSAGVDERVVHVMLRNPGSSKYRQAELWLALERSLQNGNAVV